MYQPTTLNTLVLAVMASSALVALQPSTACVGQEEQQEQAPDIAPPEVNVLAPMQAPAAAAFPELKTHREPRPLDPAAVVEDWPTFLGPRRDGHSRESALALAFGADGPPLVWELERGSGYASPAVLGERLVFTHRVGDEVLIDCVQATTGKRYWRHSIPCTYTGRYIENAGPRATPTLVDDRAYVHSVNGALLCLELSTGRVVWERNPSTEFAVGDDYFGVVSSPLVVGDLLIQNVGIPGGYSVIAFDRHTGRVAWGAGEHWGPSCASPVLAKLHGREKLLVFAGGDSRPPTGGLLVIDLESHAVDAAYAMRSRTYESVNGATPVVAGSRLFLTSSYGVGSVGLELTPEFELKELWKNRHLGLQFSTPLYEGGRVYGIDGVSGRAGALVAIDPASGEELTRTTLTWTTEVETDGETKTRSFSAGEGSLLHVDGKLLVLGDMGHLMLLEPTEDGANVLASCTLFVAGESWTPLVLSRGLLYVCQNNRARFGASPRRLLCYDLRGSS